MISHEIESKFGRVIDIDFGLDELMEFRVRYWDNQETIADELARLIKRYITDNADLSNLRDMTMVWRVRPEYTCCGEVFGKYNDFDTRTQCYVSQKPVWNAYARLCIVDGILTSEDLREVYWQ